MPETKEKINKGKGGKQGDQGNKGNRGITQGNKSGGKGRQ